MPDDSSAFRDLAAHAALRRVISLTAHPDGSRVVVAVQEPDGDCSRYRSSLWQIPLDGTDPRQLTWSDAGESTPVLAPDGSLFFLSTRPVPEAVGIEVADGDAGLWALPPGGGEAKLVAARAGGLSGPVVAARSGTVVVAGSLLVGSTEADDAERRKAHASRKVSAILHDAMPIRFWDHELGVTSPRLFVVDPLTGETRDLAPDAGAALLNADYSITADGTTVATTWRQAASHARFAPAVVLIDVATGERTQVVAEDGAEFSGPQISPHGDAVASLREIESRFDVPWAATLVIHHLSGGSAPFPHVTAELGDLSATGWVWAPDGSTLAVSGDLHGRGAVVLVDPLTGRIVRHLIEDATYSQLHVSADDASVFGLRSAVDAPPRPVAIDIAAAAVRRLPDPAPVPSLPGRLVELDVSYGDATVHGWLCLPHPVPSADAPAPVMLWIHGGPFASYNAWSWRWNPWIAVAHGWAVVLPDPALSTGYGPDAIERAWPYRAEIVWAEAQAVLDAVLERADVDGDRLACLGGSFGGFMTNWIAGHSDRFGAIVTHAGLWAADQQHVTTDAAAFKTGLFGRPAEHPDWYETYSPHLFQDRISTPMLVTHGNRDYRVPISEAMRLWFDLVEGWPGDPAELPHRFLQLTGEGHWVLNPSNAQIWWDAVLGFCGQHVLGVPWTPSPLL